GTGTTRARSPRHRGRVTATGRRADLHPEVSTGIMARERTTVAQAALKLVGKDDGDKQRALEAAIAQIDRAFGKGSVMKLGKAGQVAEIESVSTGSLGLDMALGIGGLPVGRVIEVFGPESSGKTTLALHTVAEVQKKGGVAAFVDAEHALDPVYAQKLGVDLDDLLVSQP